MWPVFVVGLALLALGQAGQQVGHHAGHHFGHHSGHHFGHHSGHHSGHQAGNKGASPADLALLFHRPAEPVFTLRGVNRTVAFDVPASYLPERYVRRARDVRSAALKAGVRLIPVAKLAMPAERFADVEAILPYRGSYTRLGNQFDATVRFWHFFDESKNVDELLARAVWARLHFNPEMVLDALLMAMLRSRLPGVKDVPLPELTQYIPEHVINADFFAQAREEMSVIPEAHRTPIAVNRNTATDEESKLSYYRHDVHHNVMHWKWHFLSPMMGDDLEYTDLPRRGEQFVFLHKQFIARYNAERFSNGLPAVKPLDLHKPLATGYFPRMVHLHSSRGIMGRQANTSLLQSSVDNLDRIVERYYGALQQGYVVRANGSNHKLSGLDGLAVISNLLEPNAKLSVNLNLYGGLHGGLHSIVSSSGDPLRQLGEPYSVGVPFTTVINDPAFFNIHMLTENLYEDYKKKYLAPYSEKELTPLPRVELQSVSVRRTGGHGPRAGELRTYFQQSDLDVSLGLDYTPAGRQYARFTHLQYRPFDYTFKILNKERRTKRVFVRVFLLMTQDEKGSRLGSNFQRQFPIQLDIFDATLKPGNNTVVRSSTASSVTTNWDDIYSNERNGLSAPKVRRQNLCRCGWPQNLLLPKGNEAGVPYKLFAMVTDYDTDKAPDSAAEVCPEGWVLCGVPGVRNFPDRRAMGFPFDRPYRRGVARLGDLLTANMAVADVVVKFDNVTEAPSALLPGGASTSWMP